MERLKTRPDFLRAAKGVRRVAPAVTLESVPTPETAAKPEICAWALRPAARSAAPSSATGPNGGSGPPLRRSFPFMG